jgi:hypothetical protein|tara:strand:- start:1409 stop:1600 length:192 start_codon:yes stop_codon:yes gene_type:complete
MAFIPDTHRAAFERQPEEPKLTPEESFKLNMRLLRDRQREEVKALHRERKLQQLKQQLEALGG